MDPALVEILKLAGGTSPLLALLIWYIWNQKAAMDKFADKFDKLTEQVSGVNTRLTVIETFVELSTRKP